MIINIFIINTHTLKHDDLTINLLINWKSMSITHEAPYFTSPTC